MRWAKRGRWEKGGGDDGVCEGDFRWCRRGTAWPAWCTAAVQEGAGQGVSARGGQREWLCGAGAGWMRGTEAILPSVRCMCAFSLLSRVGIVERRRGR